MSMAKPTRIAQQGNNLIVYMDDGSQHYARSLTGQQWLVRSAAATPPVTGGDGDTSGSGAIVVGPIPNSLSAKASDGVTWTFTKNQLTNAAGIITACAKIPAAASRKVIEIALITAIRESHFNIYANTSHFPETANYPHDANGSDSDSVGLFQQRPTAGWGTPQECMETDYSTRAFLGGPNGPNSGSPRGLFDLNPSWDTRTPGAAAQGVQVSAFPDRYQAVVPVADAIMDALIKPSGGAPDGTWQWPFQYSRWVIQGDALAQFGPRINPVTHQYQSLHAGLDFGAGGISGKPIPAASAGKVREASYNAAMGNHVWLTHAGGFETWYFHMPSTPPVKTGDTIAKGQIIGNVGQTGRATGPHLHWETHVNGTPINPRQFMKDRGVPES